LEDLSRPLNILFFNLTERFEDSENRESINEKNYDIEEIFESASENLNDLSDDEEIPRKRKSRISSWKSITIEEIYVFLTILIHYICEKKAKMRDYSEVSRYTNDSESSLKRYIDLRRFELI
jgi:hypothetical protein